MLHFILGRAGSGKTTYLRNLLADFSKKGESGMMLIVPEQFSFDTEREMLDILGPKDLNNVDILSFSRLSQTILEKYGGINKRIIDDSGKIILMSIAIENLKDKLSVYKAASGKISFASKMLETTLQMQQCGISYSDLIDVTGSIEDKILKEKAQDLALIMSAYQALLENSFYDDKNLISMAEEKLYEHCFFKDKIVAIDAFKGFTKQELNLISEILKQAKDVYITLTTDGLYDFDDGLGKFSFVKKTAKKLMDIAKKNSVKISEPIIIEYTEKSRFKNDELKFLEKNVFEITNEVYDIETNNITECISKNAHDQCEIAANLIKKLMREENIRCRDIAVITRNLEKYKNSLKIMFQKYDIPFFEDNRQPIANQPLIRLVKSILKIADSGFAFEAVMSYLKTGLTNITPDEISEVENYAVIWGITGKKWEREWVDHPDGYGNKILDDDIEKLKYLNDIRIKIVSPLQDFIRLSKDQSVERISKNVYYLLQKIDAGENLKKIAIKFEESGNTALAKEQSKVWDILMNILDQTVATIGNMKISLKKYRDLFDEIVEKEDLGSIPYGIDEVTVGDAERIRIKSPKVVFVIGANEGEFPKSLKNDGIFNKNEIDILSKCGLDMPYVYEEMAAEEKFIAYNALCSSSEKLYVVYSISDSLGNALTQSSIVSEISKLFPNHNIIDTSKIDNELYFVESKMTAFEAMSKNYKRDSELKETLKEYMRNSHEYFDKILALDRITNSEPMKIKNHDLATSLFGKNMYISATRIESYYKCSFAYYCKFGLKAKPRKKAEVDRMQVGLIIHFVLENILREYGRSILKISNEERDKKVLYYLSEYIKENMGGEENKNERFIYSVNRLSETIIAIIQRLIIELNNSEFFPVDFELKIDNDGEIPPYTLSLDDGGTLKIHGSVDRVDIMELDGKSYIRVIDYKSGEKKFDLSDVLEGLNMQMLIYLMSILENGERKYSKVSPAGVLYVPAKQGSFTEKRNITDEDVEKANIDAGKMNGFVIDDSKVYYGMEKDLKGKFVPVSEDSKGKIKGNLISLDQLEKLKKKANILLKDMAESLHEGEISVLPVYGKNYEDKKMVCNYCEYRSICGFEEGNPVRNIEKLSLEKSLEKLEEEVKL